MAEEEQNAGGGGAEKPKWPKKPPKTAEDLAAIAYLDALRAGGGDSPPARVPLACIVNRQAAGLRQRSLMTQAGEPLKLQWPGGDLRKSFTVTGPDGASWRLCVRRGTVKVGKNALFVSEAAALPVEDRFRNPSVCTVKEKVYKYGFGVKVRRLLPHVKRHIYPYNCGVLYPTADFAELKGKRAGLHVSALLRIDVAEELKLRQQDPHAWALHYKG